MLVNEHRRLQVEVIQTWKKNAMAAPRSPGSRSDR